MGFHRNELSAVPGWIRKAFTGEDSLAVDLEYEQKLIRQLRGSLGFLSRKKRWVIMLRQA